MPAAVQRLGHRRIQHRRCQQRIAVAQPGLHRRQVTLRQPLDQLARQTQAVGMDAARGQQHDGIARAELLAQRQPFLRVDQPGARGRQVDAAGFDDAGQRRRLAATPGHAAEVARTLPARHQGLRTCRVGKPVGAARRPVGLHDQRRRADGDQVVDGHGDGVLRNRVVVAAAGEARHLVGHQRLRAQAFDDAGQVERADIHHIGRLAPRVAHFAEAMRLQVHRRGRRGTLRGHLQRVDQLVVDAGLAIAERGVGGGVHAFALSGRAASPQQVRPVE